MRAVLPGFVDAVFDAQRTFRAVLTALSEPGRPIHLDIDLPPLDLAPAAAASLLALADINTTVWLAPNLFNMRAYLRFHTGAPIVDQSLKSMVSAVTPELCAFSM